MKDRPSSANMGEVLRVLKDIQNAGVIERYAIGGAVAAILHYEPISTIDLDIFFFLAEKNESPILTLTAIYDYAEKHGFSVDHEFVNIHGWLVQFVEASHSLLWTEAIEQADKISIDSFEAPVVGREHLVAMWLFAGRAKDYQKIAMFVEAAFLDETKLFDILKRHSLQTKWDKEKWRFISEE